MEPVSKTRFGQLKDGRSVYEYTLTNNKGMQVSLLDLGCTITRILVPDNAGVMDDVVLGFDTLEAYTNPANPYFGCIIGRTANRISNHCFKLEDTTWTLGKNNGDHHIHGGFKGFDKKIWKVSPFLKQQQDSAKLTFTYQSCHLEEGYPGNLVVKTTLSLGDDNTLSISYEGETDQTTLVNLTHHPYFNLAGKRNSSCLTHLLKINADRFTEPDENLLPTGKICAVDGLPIDFKILQRVDDRISKKGFPMEYTNGYDHNYVLNKDVDHEKGKCRFAAKLYDPESGRVLTITTTQPCMQFYTGNFIPKHLEGRNKSRLHPHAGLCLETQGYPDAVRHAQFESNLLEPGQTYLETTRFRFNTRRDK